MSFGKEDVLYYLTQQGFGVMPDGEGEYIPLREWDRDTGSLTVRVIPGILIVEPEKGELNGTYFWRPRALNQWASGLRVATTKAGSLAISARDSIHFGSSLEIPPRGEGEFPDREYERVLLSRVKDEIPFYNGGYDSRGIVG